jgi:NAD(P)-binding Rossmann-like domain
MYIIEQGNLLRYLVIFNEYFFFYYYFFWTRVASIINMTLHSDSQSRIAIVGTGLAGLVTAYLLHNEPKSRYRVTLFERVRMEKIIQKNCPYLC